jgi:hypothetical protein
MSDETANQLRAWAAYGPIQNIFSETKPLCDTLTQAADHIETLQAQLADRDRALAEWAEVSQRNYQRAIEAEERLAEARAGLEKLQSAAGEVSRQGAVTGPQWTRLNIALLFARATLAKIGGGE